MKRIALTLKRDELLSSFAVNFNLRRCTEEPARLRRGGVQQARARVHRPGNRPQRAERQLHHQPANSGGLRRRAADPAQEQEPREDGPVPVRAVGGVPGYGGAI